jgi:hypothetical protein
VQANDNTKTLFANGLIHRFNSEVRKSAYDLGVTTSSFASIAEYTKVLSLGDTKAFPGLSIKLQDGDSYPLPNPNGLPLQPTVSSQSTALATASGGERRSKKRKASPDGDEDDVADLKRVKKSPTVKEGEDGLEGMGSVSDSDEASKAAVKAEMGFALASTPAPDGVVRAAVKGSLEAGGAIGPSQIMAVREADDDEEIDPDEQEE